MILLFTFGLPIRGECQQDHCEVTATVKGGDSLIQQSQRNRREIVELEEMASARSLQSIMRLSGNADADLPEVVSMLATLAQNDTINASTEETHEMVDFIKNFTKLHRASLEKKRQRAQEDMNDKLDGFSTCSRKFISAVAQDKASYMVDEQASLESCTVTFYYHNCCGSDDRDITRSFDAFFANNVPLEYTVEYGDEGGCDSERCGISHRDSTLKFTDARGIQRSVTLVDNSHAAHKAQNPRFSSNCPLKQAQ